MKFNITMKQFTDMEHKDRVALIKKGFGLKRLRVTSGGITCNIGGWWSIISDCGGRIRFVKDTDGKLIVQVWNYETGKWQENFENF